MPEVNQFQEHTASYYAATANWQTAYPQIDGSHETDICIVGAGFTGIAAALTLAERGYRVTVLEANRVGWGASGRNGGQLINGISGLRKIAARHRGRYDEMLWDLRWRGNDIVFERVEKYAIDCDLKPGYVETALKPRHLKYIEDYAEEYDRRNAPFRYEVWDRARTCELLGTEAFMGAFACFRDGHLHPLNLCIGEARAAESLGVKIFEHSPVIGITHDARPRVNTAQGSVTADAVILAGNAYARLEPKHLSNLVFPAGSYIIATEPLPGETARQINPLDVAVCDLNDIVNYYRLSADGRMIYGGACNYSGREPRSIRAFIQPRLERTYPQLQNVAIDYEWGGKIGIVLNRIPAVGRINGNVYYCHGYSGHGVNASHVMAEVVADAIGGTMERFDLFADIRHFRIPGSQWLGNQIIALGMLYFRLRDML